MSNWPYKGTIAISVKRPPMVEVAVILDLRNIPQQQQEIC
jgi:hypothetical protein